ncbi:MAG: aquaporin family protein [Treponemataceae bacterium]
MNMTIFVAEFVGTALLILLGCGVCANVNLKKSGMSGGGTVQITIGWGLAVMLPAFVFGEASGAHFNPALTLALFVNGTISAPLLLPYFLGQFLGGFFGACLVYALFKDHLDAEEAAAAKRGVFCTSPSIKNAGRNLLSEIIGTFVLVFTIEGLAQVPNLNAGVAKLLVFGIIVSIGMSLGGLTGYAINPARDLAPRIAHAVLPIKGKGSSDFGYAWIPVVGPCIGGVLASLLYKLIF